MSDKVVIAYEVLNHGIENSQYFQGCGVSCTEFTDVATGCGDNAQEALEDALESLAQNGWNTDIINDEMPDSDSVSDIAEENNDQRNQEAYDSALETFLEENPDKTEDDFEFEESENDDDYPDDTYYYVSVRVRAFDPELDEPNMFLASVAMGRVADLDIEIQNIQGNNLGVSDKEAVKLNKLKKFRKYLERFSARVLYQNK